MTKKTRIKIGVVDIETSPHFSAHFGRWKLNIPKAHTLMESRMITWSFKWVGERKVTYRDEADEDFLTKLHELMDEADAIVSFNGDKFDTRRINTEFLKAGLGPYSPFSSIDLYREAKSTFGFSSNRLDDILDELGLELKVKNAGMQLWIDCVWHDDAAAWKKMEKYNKHDVVVTEKLYNYMLGWIVRHPNVALWIEPEEDGKMHCPRCESTDLRFKGYKRNKTMQYKQYHCQSCGMYPRERFAQKPTRKDVLTW